MAKDKGSLRNLMEKEEKTYWLKMNWTNVQQYTLGGIWAEVKAQMQENGSGSGGPCQREWVT